MPRARSTVTDQVFDPKVLGEISQSLQQIAASLGYIALQMSSRKRGKNTENIRFLSKFGFSRNQIVAILDSTPNSISTELSVLKATRAKEETDAVKQSG